MFPHSRLASSAVAGLLLLAGCAPATPAPPTAAPAPPIAAPAAKPTVLAAAPTTALVPTAATKPTVAATTVPAAATTAAAPQPTAASASALTGTLRIDTISEIESPHPYFSSQLVGISVRINVFD